MHDLGSLKPGAFVRIFQHGSRFAVISMLAVVLSSCGTFTNPGAPKQSFDIDKDIQALEEKFSAASGIAEYYAEFDKSGKTDEQRKKGRNKFIVGRLVLINIHYIEFIKQFAVSKAQLDSAIDIATIGVDLAITLVGAASTKAILGAVSGGLTSSKLSIDKNFFQRKTVPVLITAMNAQRKEALLPILAGMKKPIEPIEGYSLAAAVADLHAYYNAGTFIGALQAIQKDSGVKEAKADKDIKFERDKAFLETDRQKRVDKILDMIAKLTNSKAIDLIKSPPVADAKADQLVQLRDPKKLRFNKGDVARQLLKMRAVLSKRSDEALDAWEAAVKAAGSPAGNAVPRPPVEAAPLNVPPGNPPN